MIRKFWTNIFFYLKISSTFDDFQYGIHSVFENWEVSKNNLRSKVPPAINKLIVSNIACIKKKDIYRKTISKELLKKRHN